MDNSRTLACLLWIACFSTALAAREQTDVVAPKSPVIIAANAGENVRFSSVGSTAQIRVQILTLADQSIFDSGWKDGNVLDWSTDHSLAEGSYRCTVTVKDLDGQLRQKEAALVVQGGRIAIDAGAENGDPKIALLVHDEKNGAIVNTSGDLSFRFGKFFEGTDTELMRLTAEGNLGLGTDKPQAKLDVNGMIRASEGIMFSDGTVLRMSNGEVVVEKAESANPNGRRIIQTLLPSQPTAIPRRLTPSPTVSPDYQFKVDATGVHIGTTNTFGLDVAGNVTLSSNLALPTTTSSPVGVITLGNARFVHNFGTFNTFLGANAGNFTMTGSFNTAIGFTALLSNTTGSSHTATGMNALRSNAAGFDNTASGLAALYSNTSGNSNTATGSNALFSNTNGGSNAAIGTGALGANTAGSDNTASGAAALADNTTGNDNTACGLNALVSNTTGSNNIAIGVNAGSSITTGNNNIDIGNDGVPAEANTIKIGDISTQTSTFIAGISGVTVPGAALQVVVNANGQLGTASSSRRYKFDIADMGASTADLLRLRPVTFRYLAHGEGAPLQYGLIAEEVAEVYPEMVTRNKDGEVEAVMYQFLAPMLLNQVQRQQRRIEQLEERLEELEKRLATGK